jgi:hypothetical protein
LARAYHLHTQCSPRIYYRPYVLLDGQKSQIGRQIAETRAKIDVDVEGITLKHRDSLGRDARDEQDVNQMEAQDSPSPISNPKDGTVDEEG